MLSAKNSVHIVNSWQLNIAITAARLTTNAAAVVVQLAKRVLIIGTKQCKKERKNGQVENAIE